MWTTAFAAALSLAGTATYWQVDRCQESGIGEGATLRWCVEAAAITSEGALEIQASWRVSGLDGKRIFKGPDSDNRRMYLVDDLGKRYDHVATRGAAHGGGWLASDGQVLRGVFEFPPPQAGARAFRFQDDDQRASIGGIALAPESRTTPSASAAVFAGITDSKTLHVVARSADGSEERYRVERTARGVLVASGAPGEEAIPPPVLELFLRSLSEVPLLDRAYPEGAPEPGDYPATTLDVRTDKDAVFFFSRPAGGRYAPWRAEVGGKAYLVPDDSPLRALEILDPFLGRDPESRAVRMLAPYAGEEEADALWVKLEEPLGPDEALAVVRRLSDLLGRGLAKTEVWQAADEHVALAQPPPESAAVASPPSNEDLFAAVRSGDFDAVRSLISSGADANARGKDGKTLVMIAAESGRTGALQALLESGARIDGKTLDGKTALALAARNGQREAVRVLLTAGASAKVEDTHGVTALMETSDAAIARALIRGGADVNAADDKGLTALMRVAGEGGSRSPAGARVETLQSLLTAGANVRARDREGRTALIWSIKGTPSSKSDPALARMLIDAGSEIDARDREGGTPLVYAAVRGDAKSARMLVESGADVNARMGNLSSLDIALRYGHTEIVTLLVRAGARR
jgi:ankyrin repeat protein